MIGNSYAEIFTTSMKRLFRFFVDFLDTKVVPDIPSTPSILKHSEDLFIRQSYLGGATDYYKAYGENL
jgi:hypothetical protein